MDVVVLTREGPPRGNNIIQVETTVGADIMLHVGIPPDNDVGPRLLKVKRDGGENHMHHQNGVIYVCRADNADDLSARDPLIGHIRINTDLVLEIDGNPRTIHSSPAVVAIPQLMFDTIKRYMVVQTPLHP